ncbi:DNA alkylation repair protein [Alistipes sp.]|uniref:DNA alkylation repair protein n=1 Tax=Alistipes sp. TaxID=1872444 RepID=UPI003AF5D069
MTLRDQLLELCEPKYMKFTSALMPGVENVLGIRLPLLRKIAREIAAGDWRAYLAQAGDFYFEERMLQGMVISYARCGPAEKLEHVARFIPKIDNWAVCDCFCWRLKAAEREPMWEFIRPRFRSEAEYEVRFAVVMALGNFVDQAHIEDLLQLLDGIRHEAYYARMGVAWAVSVCYIKFPERTHAWLESCSLDDWTFNKSLQKIVESYRVSDAAKQQIRAMKRRK